MTGLFLKKI